MKKKYLTGFTLIEILIAFAVSSVIAGISFTSFNAYSNTQIFNQNVSNVVDLLGIARSRSISQVKPASCGTSPLEGYEVRVTTSGTAYSYYVKCGGSSYLMESKKLHSELIFANNSAASVHFNVLNGTVSLPGDIIISGFGKANTIIVEKSGKILVINGTGPPPAFSTPTPTPDPTAQQGCSPSVAAYRLYPPNYCVYTAPGYGDYCDPTCGLTSPSPTTVVATATPTTSTLNPTPTPTTTSCSKDYYYSEPYCPFVGGNNGTHCEATCGGQVSTNSTPTPTPTPTTAPVVNPTPTPTPTPVSSTPSVTIALSVSPNPATTSQSITFTATVTGTNCTPTGAVYFYRDNQASYFTAASTGSTNPGIASASYPASYIGAGAHTVHGRYVPGGTTCPAITSSNISFSIQ
jgi:Tfp pilus assembly protein FimT